MPPYEVTSSISVQIGAPARTKGDGERTMNVFYLIRRRSIDGRRTIVKVEDA